MRWITGILVVIISSCLGLFTSYATVDMLPGHEKTITAKPEDNIIGIDESEGSDAVITENNESTVEKTAEKVLNPDEVQVVEGSNPNDKNDTFDEQAEEAKPYKLFLIMGTDVVYSGSGKKTRSLQGRTDSLMIAKMSDSGVELISLPRDSRVNIPGFGYDKINAANVYGGPELVMKTIEKWLNIHIEDYAIINTFGIVQFVNLFGGVDFNIPKRMRYTDHTANLYIDLYPGYQHLDGLKVHNFLRFRHDGLGDLSRVSRQQQMIKVMVPRILKPLNLLKIPSAIGVINDNIQTNLSTRKILYLANKALYITDLKENITMHTIPGTGGMYHGGWYWLVDEKGTNKLLQKLSLIPGGNNLANDPDKNSQLSNNSKPTQ